MESKINTMTEATNGAKTNTKNAGEASKGDLWKSVLVGGVPGILIGGTGMFIAQELMAKDEDGGTVDHFGEAEIQESHLVNDSMSFKEAFSTARADVGPGGAFIWHGKVYGTYDVHDPEWIDMSYAERQAHSELILSQVHPVPYVSMTPEPTIEEVPEEIVLAQEPVVAEEPIVAEEPVVIEEPIVAEESVQAQESSDLYVYGVETVENEDGETINVAYGTYGDHMMTMVDTDNDSIMDTLVVDDNNNLMADHGEDQQLAGPGTSGDPSDAADISDLL